MDNALFRHMRGLTERRKTPRELEADAAYAKAGMARRDAADLERFRARNASAESAAAREFSAAEADKNRKLQERIDYRRQYGREMPSESPATRTDQEVSMNASRLRNIDWAERRQREIDAKSLSGWKPSISFRGSANDALQTVSGIPGEVRANAEMMRQGEMQAQRSRLSDMTASNVRGMDKLRSAMEAVRPPHQQMMSRDRQGGMTGNPEQVFGDFQAQRNAGLQDTDQNVADSKELIARRMMQERPWDQLGSQQGEIERLRAATEANQLIGGNSPIGEQALLGRMTPEQQVAYWSGGAESTPTATPSFPEPTRPPLARQMPAQQPQIETRQLEPIAPAQVQQAQQPSPGLSFLRDPMGALRGMARPIQESFADMMAKRAAQTGQEIAASAAQSAPTQTNEPPLGSALRGRMIEQQGRMQQLQQGATAFNRELEGGNEAIRARMRSALNLASSAKNTDELISFIEHALTTAPLESDVVDLHQMINDFRPYQTAPKDVRDYIQALIYNVRAKKAKMQPIPLPQRPQDRPSNLLDARSNQPINYDTEMLLGG